MVPRVTLDSRVVSSGSQLSSTLGEETVILGVESGTYYGLDQVGTRIWSLLSEEHSIEEIRDVIVSEYDVTPERCAEDLVTLVQELVERGLVRVSGDAS